MTLTSSASPPPRRYYVEVFLTCFAGLLLEIGYTRIFSFKLFYFFTYLVIGVALLGLGASGVFVVVSKRARRLPLDRLVALASLLGAASVAGGYILIARLPMDTFALADSATECARFALLCGTLFVPFFAIGLSISSILGRTSAAVDRLYFADLAGAALGCVSAIPLISTLGPPSAVLLGGAALALAGLCAASSWSWAVAGTHAVVLLCSFACAICPAVLPTIVTDRQKPFHVEPPNEQQSLFSEWGPLFRIDVFDFPATTWPFRAVSHDAMPGSTLQSFPGDLSALTHFEKDGRAIPFALAGPGPKELIIGAAGGHEILAGLYFGAGHITGIEINPVTYSLVREVFADYTGHLAERPNVQYLNDEGRSYLRRSRDRFDIINFVSPDSYSATNAATSSAFVMSESYLYTVEMVGESLDHLNDHGFIVMELGDHNYEQRPYRTLSYLSTAREAFHRRGVTDFGDHVLLIRTPGFLPTSIILLKESPFSPADIDRVSAAVAKIPDAQVVYAPGRVAAPAPATEIITIPYDRLPAWYDAYRYDVGPVYDDSPFF